MFDNGSKGISYAAGFFMLIAFTIAGIYLYSVVRYPVWTIMTGKPISEMETAMTSPAYSTVGKVLQALSAILGFFVPAVVAASLLNKKPFRLLGFSGDLKLGQAGLTIVIIGIALIVSSALAYFNGLIPVSAEMKTTFDKMENEYNQEVIAIIGLNSPGEFIIAIIVMAFLPALCEETLFRGGLQNFLTRSTKIPWLSIVIVSIIFSVVHFSYYGFLSRFFLGLILGLIYHYSGRLWLSILAHFINNALAITILYVNKLNGKPLSETITENSGSWWGIFALPLVIGLLVVLKRFSFNTRPQV